MKKQYAAYGLFFFLSGVLATSWWEAPRPALWALTGTCLPGDINGDARVDPTDALSLLLYLFQGDTPPAPCDCGGRDVSTVFLVRHAEKADDDPLDPGLTAEGEERAARLAAMLADVKVDRLIASDRRRTSETLVPLAESREDLSADNIARIEEPADVATALRGMPGGSTAVVAHHSFTIRPILGALGARAEDIAELSDVASSYTNLLIVQFAGNGPPRLLRLRY